MTSLDIFAVAALALNTSLCEFGLVHLRPFRSSGRQTNAACSSSCFVAFQFPILTMKLPIVRESGLTLRYGSNL